MADDIHSDPTEPPEPPRLRRLRRLVTGLMWVMIAGIIAIVLLLALRLNAPGAPALPTLPDRIALPEGAVPMAVTAGPGWYAVVTRDQRILIFDAATGALRQDVEIAPPRP